MSETTSCLSRLELLAEIAKHLPDSISCEQLEKGLTLRLDCPSCSKAPTYVQVVQLQDGAAVSGTTSIITSDTLAASPTTVSTSTQTANDEKVLEREPSTSSCSLDEPCSVNSATGELHYRELFEKMKMAAALHEVIIENGVVVDTRFKDVNSAFCAYFGLEKDDIIGNRMTKVFPGIENDQVQWIKHFGQAGVEGKTFEFNEYSQHLKRWYTGVAYRPDPARTDFCCVFIDRSKDVVTQEDLRESEERHRNLFECMVQGVVYQDAAGQIIRANPSAERILGLTVDQMMGRQSIDPRWKAVRADGSDFPGDQHPAMVALRTGEKQMNVIMGVYHPGEERHHWIKVDGIPRFHLNCSSPFQVYTTFTDITEEKRASEAMIEAKEKAQRADSLKSAFVANMSHEIRTPLNGIMGYIDLAVSNELSVESRLENLEGLKIAKSSGELLLTIIQDILDLSKIEAGSMRLHPDEVYSLKKLVTTATNAAQRMIESKKKDIKVVSHVDPKLCDSMLGDQFRLAQILNNLLSNAVKFTKQGQVGVDVTLVSEETVQIQVQDTGKGIPQSFMETIFEPFRQVEIGDTRNHGGTGLGLTISRKLARMMGGDLCVQSSVEDMNRGSCFTVTLPYRPSEKEAVQPDTTNHLEQHKRRRESMGKLAKKILVSEDDPISRRMIHRMLSVSGYEVVLACTGQEAVSMYEKNRDVGLILMDIQMPIMDGYEATQKIREKEKAVSGGKSRIPIIALSASAMKDDMERGMAHGMTDYLTKPVNLKVLTSTLEACMG